MARPVVPDFSPGIFEWHQGTLHAQTLVRSTLRWNRVNAGILRPRDCSNQIQVVSLMTPMAQLTRIFRGTRDARVGTTPVESHKTDCHKSPWIRKSVHRPYVNVPLDLKVRTEAMPAIAINLSSAWVMFVNGHVLRMCRQIDLALDTSRRFLVAVTAAQHTQSSDHRHRDGERRGCCCPSRYSEEVLTRYPLGIPKMPFFPK
jgi:hypothetical protein